MSVQSRALFFLSVFCLSVCLCLCVCVCVCVCSAVGEKLAVVGSPYWMAPEVLRDEPYNETVGL